MDLIDTRRLSAAPPAELLDAFLALRREARLRHRDAAARLGLSEGQAVAAAVSAPPPFSAVRLAPPWPRLFERMPSLGRVMALTRNEGAVHEKLGVYADMSHRAGVGLALGPDIDLRIFYAAWAHAFAVTEQAEDGAPQRSLQVFDAQGVAVHKVILKPGADLPAWERFVSEFAHTDQEPGLQPEPAEPAAPPPPDHAVDVLAFQAAWRALADTHEFFGLVRRFGLARTQALRLAPPGHAERVPSGVLATLLEAVAAEGLPIMVFVGNPGMIQIHTGPVKTVKRMGPWLNVLDPGFNLHLREDLIDQAWIVRKPTADGVVSSLELFDAAGETLAMLFGERKPGRAELPAWRALLAALPREVVHG